MSVQVSVILTAFDSGVGFDFHEQLESTLAALENAGMNEIEVLILGDGADAYLDAEMRQRLGAFKGGISFEQVVPENAKSVGLSRARGRFVSFLKAGDIVMPFSYRTMVAHATGDCDVIMMGSVPAGATSDASSSFTDAISLACPWSLISGWDAMYHVLMEHRMPYLYGMQYTNKLFRRERLIQYRLPFAGIRTFDDGMPLVMMGIARRICVLDACGFVSNNPAETGCADGGDFCNASQSDLVHITKHLKSLLVGRQLFSRIEKEFIRFFGERLWGIPQTPTLSLPAPPVSDDCVQDDDAQNHQGFNSENSSLTGDVALNTLYLSYLSYLARFGRGGRRLNSGAPPGNVLASAGSEYKHSSLSGGRREGGRRLTNNRGFGAPDLVTIVTVAKNIFQGGRNQPFETMLSSVAAQTYGRDRIEHIVVDGASSDGTVDYLDALSRAGLIDYWVSEPDSGIYNAMNKGVRLAFGRYVLFLNSDDFLSHDALSRLVDAIESQGVDYAFADAWFIDETDQRVGEQIANMHAVFFGTPWCHQTLLCKRQCFDSVMYNESFRITMWQYAIDLYLSGLKYAYVSGHLASFRVGGASTGPGSRARFKREQDEIKRHLVVPGLNIDIWEYEYLNHVRQHWKLDAFEDIDVASLNARLDIMLNASDSFQRAFARSVFSFVSYVPGQDGSAAAFKCL